MIDWDLAVGTSVEAFEAAFEAFDQQRRNARRRDIPFMFSFPEWRVWWQIDNRWERRGVRRDSLVMARRGDLGPYSPDNVYCATQAQNMQERHADKAKSSESGKRAHQTRLARGGYGMPHHLKAGGTHPRSRPVLTPDGRFENIRIAADHYGIHPATASQRIQHGRFGWRYAG